MRENVRRYRWPLMLIVAPTIIVALYYLMFAADQYVSEASFLIRSPQEAASPSMLGKLIGGGQMPPTAEAAGVTDFLTSHDAVRELQKRLDIVSMYRRPTLDVFGRIKAHPTEEELTKYVDRHVKVVLNKETGIIDLQVRAFRPRDSRLIADTLLVLSENLVNRFSERAQDDAVKVAQDEVNRAQLHLKSLGGGSNASSTVVVGVMGGLETELAKARADLAAASGYLRQGSPQLTALQARVSALQGQVTAQQSRLAGPSRLGGAGDQLMTERDFAMKDYEAALSAYEIARIDAVKKHMYLVRIVEPNTAQKSTFPRRWLNILTVFSCLLTAYGIGWLIITGTREHAI